MSRNLAIIGMPTYQLSSLTSGIAPPAGMPLSNLNTPELWRPCRLPTGDASLLWIRGQLLPKDPYTDLVARPANGQYVGGAALAHNMAPGSEWRLLLGTESIDFPDFQRCVPNAVGLSNFTGDETDIDDDPYNSTSDALECTNTSSSLAATIEFETPSSAPLGEQLIRVKIEYDTGGINIDTIGVNVYDNIDILATWHSFEGGNSIPQSGSVLEIPWDASDLSTPSGANVRVQLAVGQAGGTATAGAFKIVAVDWVAADETPPGVTADSGWLPATAEDPTAGWGNTTPLSVGLPPAQISTWVNTGGVEVQATHSLVMLRNPFDQVGYTDIGRLMLAPVFMPGINRDWGQLLSNEGRDVVVEADGGSAFGVRRRPLREMPIPLSWLTYTEAMELQERAWRSGMLEPFVVSVFESGSPTRHTNLYCRWKELPKIDLPRGFPDWMSLTATVRETR